MKNIMRYVCGIIVMIIVVGIIFLINQRFNETDDQKNDTELLQDVYQIEIAVARYGNIIVELDTQYAPITVTNFIRLVKEKFYDGLTFHRIIEGFMIQGGDPTGTGMGGSTHKIKGEFSNNGINNSLSHTRGVISMARSKAYDSASSQFFIVQQDSFHLDGDYAAFGRVIEGMNVVDEIVQQTKVENGEGTVLKENQPVITSIRMIQS